MITTATKKTEEEVINYIKNGKNSNFRSTDDMKDSSFIFDAQIETAKKIVLALNEKVTRRNHVMLLAKMQGGKTGCCNAAVNIIDQSGIDKFMAVDKFFFITGMNDCGLKFQTYERLIEQVTKANVANVYDSKRSKKYKTEKRYYVLKNSDLPDFEEDINNSVIFIDECHYGSNESNILTKFLVKNGIDWKNQNTLISRNIYIVSISATPFDEIISDTADCKRCIELKTDKEYVGVTDFVDNGLIHSGKFNDIVGSVTFHLADALEQMKKDNVCGVCFVRTRDFAGFENDDFVNYNFDIHEMYSNGTKIEYDKLNDRINQLVADNKHNKKYEGVTLPFLLKQRKEIKPLLVLIKGAFRAGITLKAEHKDYIYMVYDYSLKSAATAQALLGRLCGYRHSDAELKTHFYINQRQADMYSDWEQDFSNKNNVPCDKVQWVWTDGTFTGNDCEFSSKSCGNFEIELTDEEIISIYNISKNRKTGRKTMNRFLKDFFLKKGIDAPYDYLHEYAIKGKNNYKESSQLRRFDSFSPDLMVYEFRPSKMKDFMDETGRDFLTADDLGKRCVSVVLDAFIDKDKDRVLCGGNNRLLVYYCEVAQRRIVANQKANYRKHKDTKLIDVQN